MSARPICPYAGLPVIRLGFKVMAFLHSTHHTSPCYFWWAYISPYQKLFFSVKKCYLLSRLPSSLFQLLVLLQRTMGALARSIALVVGTCFCWVCPCKAVESCCGFGRHLRTNWLLVLFIMMGVTVAGLVSPHANTLLVQGVAS